MVPRAGPVAELRFAVESAQPLEYAAVPTLIFGLRIEAPEGLPVRSVTLDTQIRIASTRRSYDGGEQERLVELFGAPEQWARSLQSLHWTNLVMHVPGFSGSTLVDLAVPCSSDFELTAGRYFGALEHGEAALEFLFSGTVFYAGADGRLQVARIGWDKDAEFRLPVAAWRDLMQRHYPDAQWLRLRRSAFDRLQGYKARHTLLSFEDALDALLDRAERDGA